jgi:hypothetical protein
MTLASTPRQLAADPCSPNGTAPPNDLNQTWSKLSSDVCWQMPCEPPLSFGVDPSTRAFRAANHTGGPLTIDLGGHEVWCYNQTMHTATVMSVSGATSSGR